MNKTYERQRLMERLWRDDLMGLFPALWEELIRHGFCAIPHNGGWTLYYLGVSR